MVEDDKGMVGHDPPGRFEPPTESEEIIYLLNQDRPWQAAQRLAKLEFCDQAFLCALADLIGGDFRVNPELAQIYSYRLALVGGNRPGPKPKTLQASLDAKSNTEAVCSDACRLEKALIGKEGKNACNPNPPQIDGPTDPSYPLSQSKASKSSEDIIALLVSGFTADAALEMRQLEFGSKALLQTLADMIGSGAEGHQELASTYAYRLVLESWGIKGRKPRPSYAKSKGHPYYEPQKTRLDVHRAGQMRRVADGTIGIEEINIQSNKPTRISLARMVKRRMSRGMSCAKAVHEVAEAHFLTDGWVKKAFNTSKKLVKTVRSRPPLPPQPKSIGI